MTLPGGWRLAVHDRLASTAGLCRACAEHGESEGLAILALEQTAGRGTRGRAWAGATGNVFLSVLLRPGGPARGAGRWSLLAGVAVAEALSAHLPATAPLSLKWPNDVLLGGRKVAGILAESAADAQGRLVWLALGFGVNLSVAPTVPGRSTACLAEFAPAPQPETFAVALLCQLTRWRDLAEKSGFAAVRSAFLARAPAAGTPVKLQLGDHTLNGAFAGLAEDGALLLRHDDCLRAYAAGEVTIGMG